MIFYKKSKSYKILQNPRSNIVWKKNIERPLDLSSLFFCGDMRELPLDFIKGYIGSNCWIFRKGKERRRDRQKLGQL